MNARVKMRIEYAVWLVDYLIRRSETYLYIQTGLDDTCINDIYITECRTVIKIPLADIQAKLNTITQSYTNDDYIEIDGRGRVVPVFEADVNK